jgi:hypothetical protein
MTHELKIWPQYYQRVADGSKTFEIRDNDRCFQCGDTVRLLHYDPKILAYDTNQPPLIFKIGFVLPVDEKRVVFSLRPITAEV